MSIVRTKMNYVEWLIALKQSMSQQALKSTRWCDVIYFLPFSMIFLSFCYSFTCSRLFLSFIFSLSLVFDMKLLTCGQSKKMKRSEPAHERLYASRKYSIAKREMLKMELREQEKQQFTGKPEINPVSQTLERGIDSFARWVCDPLFVLFSPTWENKYVFVWYCDCLCVILATKNRFEFADDTLGIFYSTISVLCFFLCFLLSLIGCGET